MGIYVTALPERARDDHGTGNRKIVRARVAEGCDETEFLDMTRKLHTRP